MEGKALALVTDAGTPGINDPGNELIAYLLSDHSGTPPTIIPIPGPNAAIAALSISGFPTDRFLFLGFSPAKRKRQKFFSIIAEINIAVVFFESPHRIIKTLEEFAPNVSGRNVVVARELTKKFEIVYRGDAEKIKELLRREEPIRGEFVIIVEPKKES